MGTRSAALSAVLVLILAAPTASEAATLEADRPCYGEDESVLLTGSGFAPNGHVRLASQGARLATLATDPDGAFTTRVSLPAGLWGLGLRFVATDSSDRRVVAGTAIRVVAPNVALRPAPAAPWRLRIRARGFIEMPALYAHVRRKGAARARTVRLGRPRGACGSLVVERRIFRPGARRGAYTLQFDSIPSYIPRLASSVRYHVTIR